MKDIRIGNDINVKWSIFGDDAPYILEGKDVSLYLCTPYGKRKAEGFSIVGNQITWTFAGKDQSRTGKYSLELVVNADKEGQVTTDACNFVNLVNCSCKVGGADEANVTTESIELTSELGFLPYDDTEIRNEIKKKQDALISGENIKTINGQSLLGEGDIVIEGGSGGGSYDDTGIKKDISDLKANDALQDTKLAKLSGEIALRNVCAEDTDESVDEPDLPTPSVNGEWKCVMERRMVEGESNIICTTYADGTPLKATELRFQMIVDMVSSRIVTGYIYIHSSSNSTNCAYGTIDFESNQLPQGKKWWSEVRIKTSPTFTTMADIVKNLRNDYSHTSNWNGNVGNNPQIYEDIVQITITPNAAISSAAPYIRVYAR